MRLIIILLIFFQFGFSQQFEEAKLKCSRGKTAQRILSKYTASTAAQADFDANFYDIDLKIDPTQYLISGTVSIEGTAVVNDFKVVELDLSLGMEIESIKDDSGTDLNYTYDLNLLSITLKNAINNGDRFNIIVRYYGQPQSTGFGSFGFDTHGGQPMIWSLSEPYGARDWWPSKDDPSDKADSVNISLEVPTGLIAASNGKLVNTVADGDWTTYHWEERYPIATYLVSVAIHPYTVFYDWYKYSPTDSMRLEFYVFPDNYDAVQENYGLTKDMISAMADLFGEYPFINEKYGHAEFTWGGGMEHQTLSSLGAKTSIPSEALIAHELGHQWWGDMLTCANFHHIWLNEGFASYSEALWYEKKYDIQAMHEYMELLVYEGAGTIFVDDTTRIDRIFHTGLSYNKAAWVLHMLRHVVGDEDFFNGIQEYGDRYRFKSAVTEQFRDVMAEVSGQDLDHFFQRWIYGEYFPIYQVIYSQVDNQLLIKVNQVQDSDIFKMPVDIVANFFDGSSEKYIIKNSEREQLFSLAIPEGKSLIDLEFDPDNWILKQISEIRLDTTDNWNVPTKFKLDRVFPNPFNAGLKIKFTTPEESIVKFNIFDITGKNIWSHSDKFLPGSQIITWDGRDKIGNKLASGTYFIEARSGNITQSQKISFVK